MKISLTIILAIIPFIGFAQKKEKKPVPTYQSVENATPETAFPIAKLIFGDNCSIASFDMFERKLTTHYYAYAGLFTQKRAIITLTISPNNLLDVYIGNIERYNKQYGVWESTLSSALGPEESERIKLTDLFRKNLADTAIVSKAQAEFFQDLDINSIFYSNASELAGERWFNAYLKDRKVSWNVTFIDLKKNRDVANGFAYEERHASRTYNVLTDPFLTGIKFTIFKYTNNDKLVSAKKGTQLQLVGYCRKLEYNNGQFFIILTDNLSDKMSSSNSASTQSEKTTTLLDSSDKLLKLKELLDKGVITKDEFDKEKKKILNGN